MPTAPILPEDLRTKLSRIRGLILDVDGVLTDGSMTFDEDGREWKTFDVKDGLGIVLLRDLGYKIGIVSSRVSRVVLARCRDLKLPEGYVLQGERDKAAAFDRMAALWELQSWEIAVVGDDLPDLGMLRRAGVGACPADAVAIVREAAALRLGRPGGSGAVREMCDLILEARRGSRADRPTSVPPEHPAAGDGDVIPFPGSRG
jgi:3-deoxy-D-manno-octulosonate 8-phosphate phosphatase (KDO 8-P phosphatase)